MGMQLVNKSGEIVAVRYNGGSVRGQMADVAMPKTVADIVGSMRVHEETSPDLVTTLSEWIKDMTQTGHTVRYGLQS